MSKKDNENITEKNKKGKYLTYENRLFIEEQYKRLSLNLIAYILRRSVKTIKRELKRGAYQHQKSDLTFETAYSARKAQDDFEYKQTAKGPQLKIGNDKAFAQYIENGIKVRKRSPEALVKEAETYQKETGIKFKVDICARTIRNYIKSGNILDIKHEETLYPRKTGKNTIKPRKNSKKIPPEKSIDKRPEEVNRRERDCDWEGDLVVGKQGTKTVLLTLTNRRFRTEIIRKLPNKESKTIVEAFNELEREYGEKFRQKFRTITFDNGSEFLDWAGIEKSCLNENGRTTVYYAHPYSSYERGTNENANRMIRRHIPKGLDIGDYTDEKIYEIEQFINNYPRPMFGYKSALQMEQTS